LTGSNQSSQHHTVTLLHTHVEGVARRKVEAERAERRSGLTD